MPKSLERLGVVGIILEEKWRGQGYGTEAIQTVLPFLYDERRVTRVIMGCSKMNIACRCMIEKLGFQPISLVRRAALVASGWVSPDELWYEALPTGHGTILAL